MECALWVGQPQWSKHGQLYLASHVRGRVSGHRDGRVSGLSSLKYVTLALKKWNKVNEVSQV